MAGSGKVINYARSKLLCQPVDFVCWPVVGPGEARAKQGRRPVRPMVTFYPHLRQGRPRFWTLVQGLLQGRGDCGQSRRYWRRRCPDLIRKYPDFPRKSPDFPRFPPFFPRNPSDIPREDLHLCGLQSQKSGLRWLRPAGRLFARI